ncbi:MAG: protoglobin domain-containing protein [Candidatus Binataceae bacterium]
MDRNARIPGYEYDSRLLPHSPVSLDELRSLEQAAGFGEADREWLRRAAPILAPHAEEIVDGWRAAIAAHPEMARVFFGPDGKPDESYKAAVKKRFVQWVVDACERGHDQAWLDYQEEIGKRHTPVKKNQTERSQTPPVVPLRYLIAFSAIVSTTIRPLLEKSGCGTAEIQHIQDAWTKSMLLHLALWARPYIAGCLW